MNMAKSLLLLAFSLMAGCSLEAHADDPSPHSYAARGVVEKINPDHHHITIHHEDIPGYMMSMTMEFYVKDSHELEGLSAGDQITFTLVVDNERSWVEHLHRTGHTDSTPKSSMPGMSMESSPAKLKPGDQVPDGEFLTEQGTKIHLSDFRGKAVAFTFFFTRCPLPDFCPLMNRNFAEARTLLLAAPGGPANWQFLSISFDASFDHPETLTSYASFYRGKDTDRWLFASADPTTLAAMAPPLGLMIMGQDAALSHNLRTVVVDTKGRLFRQFNDNLWKPQQLADAMTAASRVAD
jgi:protein SCO1/2